MRLLTAILSGISCAVLFAMINALLAIEWVLSTLMSVSDGLFDFVEFHLQDQYLTLMKALHGDDWQPKGEGEEDGE
jgi:hypothetical protein